MSIQNIPDFNAKVAVVGDVMLDRYWSGPSSRISPEAPVPIVRITNHEDRAGGAANVAINVASLGAPCMLVGIVGADEAALKLEKLVKNYKVDTNFITADNLPTITKLRVLSRNQQLMRLDFEEGFHNVDKGRMMQALRQALEECRAVVCSDYGKGALSSIQSMIKTANDADIPVLIDPKGTDFERYSNAFILTPNMSEFEAVAGKVKDEEDLVKKALKMISDFKLKALLVTRSEQGMSLIRPNQNPVHLPARAREVYDVTGAGDTVIATLAAALAAGRDLVTSCELANRAAGIVVGRLGSSAVTLEELTESIVGIREVKRGIVSEDELTGITARLKAKGRRIVMTNGCFDILHKGHIDYLKSARTLGDYLIVAVNSDRSVKRLKGSDRPVVPLEGRLAVLSALECVDFVVPFDEDTPQRLIAKVLPHVLVKGGDYTVEQIAGHKEVLASGGQVITLPLTAGFSTTNIIDKIKEKAPILA